MRKSAKKQQSQFQTVQRTVSSENVAHDNADINNFWKGSRWFYRQCRRTLRMSSCESRLGVCGVVKEEKGAKFFVTISLKKSEGAKTAENSCRLSGSHVCLGTFALNFLPFGHNTASDVSYFSCYSAPAEERKKREDLRQRFGTSATRSLWPVARFIISCQEFRERTLRSARIRESVQFAQVDREKLLYFLLPRFNKQLITDEYLIWTHHMSQLLGTYCSLVLTKICAYFDVCCTLISDLCMLVRISQNFYSHELFVETL